MLTRPNNLHPKPTNRDIIASEAEGRHRNGSASGRPFARSEARKKAQAILFDVAKLRDGEALDNYSGRSSASHAGIGPGPVLAGRDRAALACSWLER